ncbi:MAG: BatA and WFA domain-containing protein [Candidatus Binatia bacterium]
MGFAEPLALLFAGLYGVLVFFYLWERWRRRVVVPSLLLWEAVREDTLRARRFRPDLLFVLQLLLLTCFIAGLARPYLSNGASAPQRGRHIFVLDTSASMQAREIRRARFDEAREQALELLKSLQGDEEVMLITTAPSPEVLVNFTREHDAVAQALERLAPTDTGCDFSVALAFAESAMQRSDIPTELDVFTDMPRSQLPESSRAHARVFQVGETDANIGIEALQVFQGRFQDYRRTRAYVLVENFGHREGHGFLTVRLENRVVNRTGFTLPPRESREFVVHGFPGPGRVVAQLEASDALEADNVAFGWIRSVRPVRLLLVSPSSPLVDDLRQVVTATAALQLAVVDPETFSPDQARLADLVIFNRFVPQSYPATNALYIYPPRGNSLFPIADDAENVEVLDWDTHHPVLQSLRPLAALPLQHARILTPPAWSQVLLWSRDAAREFPLALAGEDNGHRVACITFDLESERLLGSDNLNFFFFFMNLLGWLAPNGEETRVVRTGEVTPLGNLANEPAQVQDPHGDVVTLPAGQTTLQPLHAGEYRVSVGGTSQLLLANFFDPVESDIGRSGKEVTMPPQPVMHGVQPTPVSARHEYGSWVYYAAAALLLFEWVVAQRRSA